MKVFVTGAAGQLGHDVLNELAARGHEGIGSDIKEAYSGVCDGTAAEKMPYIPLDITDADAVRRVLENVRPDVVVHCAAWTAVDLAEEEEKQETVRAVNAEGTRNIAVLCRDLGAKMVYISTDYVFNGEGQEPWQPDCKDYSPLNVYGRTKLEGELAVSEILDKYFIVRIAWVFGKSGKNFIRTMLNVGKNHDRLTVVNDQIGRLTFADDMARAIFWLLGYRDGDIEPSSPVPFGTYNYTCSGEPASWTDVAWEVFELANGNASCVRPVSTKEYCANAHAITASRPKHSVLDLSKIKAKGLRSKDWESGLSGFMNVYEVRVGE